MSSFRKPILTKIHRPPTRCLWDVAIFSTTAYGHMVRMNEQHKTKQVFEARTEERRRRGRPKKEWEQYVNEVARKRGKEIQAVRRLGQVRKQFSKWIEGPTLNGRRESWRRRRRRRRSRRRRITINPPKNINTSWLILAVFLRSNFRFLPVLQYEREEKYICYILLKCLMMTHKTHPPRWLNPSINKREREREREREKYTRAGPQSHTQTLNPILVEEQIYVQYSCSRPLHHIFQMGALLAWPTVARDGKSIYLAMKILYIVAALGRAVFILIYKFKYKWKDIILMK